MICISLPGPSLEDLLEQLSLALQEADLIEFRLDLYDHSSIVRNVIDSCFLPTIFTLRSQENGGFFKGNESDQLEILSSLIDLKPDYIDLDNSICAEYLKIFPSEIKIIRSYHNFEKTPEDLDVVLDELSSIPADLYKIATMANTTQDALRLLNFAKDSQKPLTAMAMGEIGEITRVLGPVVGCPFVYASLNRKTSTAPGQISATTLRSVYHHNLLDRETSLFGLVGDPVKQSIGHLVHNTNMKDQGAVYVKLHVTPDELEPCLELAVKLGFKGLSVTIPHKESIIPLLDEVDDVAGTIGAVNTVTIKNGRLYGSNTDANGALDAIESVTPVSKKQMILLGAGGAIRAVAFEAKRRGGELVILNRDPLRAKQLAEELSCRWGSLDQVGDYSYDIIINGTPNPMPIDPEKIRAKTLAMDLSITPEDTAFLQAARKVGCTIIYGKEMFLKQAQGQTETWFKVSCPCFDP